MDRADAPTIQRLFVYGTLRPGDVRWPMLRRFVEDEGVDDTAPGTLYDTGLGYPAAIFDVGTGRIVGRTYRLRAATLHVALRALDREEDTVLGLYRRISITTGMGEQAWAYRYGTGLRLTPIASGDWFDR